jgi:hypothetical protein
LGAADHFYSAAPGVKAHFRKLRGFARSGVAGYDHHIVAVNGVDYFIPVGSYRQLIGVFYFTGYVHELYVKNTIAHQIICAMLFTIKFSATHGRINC